MLSVYTPLCFIIASIDHVFRSIPCVFIAGKTLKTSDDLQTTACTTPIQGIHKHVREALNQVHDEVSSKYFGCGLAIPDCLDGMKVLDLGSGSGRDCFAVAKLVGKDGFVTGIDMTDEQVG